MGKEIITTAPEKATYIMANCADDGNRYWFPMRVSYGRAASVAMELREKRYDIEFFLPTEERTIFHNGKFEYYILTQKEVKERKVKEESEGSKIVRIRHTDYITKQKDILEIPSSVNDCDFITRDSRETSKQVEIPLISSIIFIRATRTEIRELKNSIAPFTYLRFMAFSSHNAIKRTVSNSNIWAERRISVIPRIQMEHFIKVMEEQKNHVTLIPYDSFEKYIGKKIRFIDGPFKGQEATIRRDGKKQNKRFFFDLGNIIVARVDYIPKQQYEIIG